MKDFVLLVAVAVVLIIGLGWFLLPGSTAGFFRSRIDIRPEEPDIPAAAAPLSTPTPTLPRQSVGIVRPQASVSPVIAALPPVEKEPAAAPPEPTQLPYPWEVPPGEAKADVVDTYGAPALAIATQDDGHLFETYVYRNNRTEAIVHLEDGKVSRVSFKDSPQMVKP